MTESSIAEITKELQSSNLTDDLILDTLDGFNPVLNSNVARENLEKFDKYSFSVVDLLDTTKTWLSDIYDELVKGSIKERLSDIFDQLTGNKMQEEENRREMLEVLSNIGAGGSPGNVPPPLPSSNSDDGSSNPIKAGITAGISQVVMSKIAALIPQSIKGMFVTVASFFASFLKFGKTLIKFAGPIGIAISIITGLIGAIRGGIEGFKEGGVEGAIKGALIGAIDGLIGTLVKGVANAAGWLLSALGLTQIGEALGPAVKGIFDAIYNSIKGVVDIIVGFVTLDADKVIGGLKTVFSSIFSVFQILGSLLLTVIKEIIPLIGKAIKAVFWNLPMFLGEMFTRALDFLMNDFPILLRSAIEKVSIFIGELMNKFITDLWPWLIEKFNTMLGSLTSVISNLFDGVFNWFGEILNWEAVAEKIGDAGDFIGKLGRKVWRFIKGIVSSVLSFFDAPGEMISSAWGNVIEFRNNLYKKILQKILPPKLDEERSWFNPMHWVAKAIPDSVYEFAGMPTTKAGKAAASKPDAVVPQVGYNKVKGPKYNPASIQPTPSSAGATLSQASTVGSNAPVIINNMGGNVTNTTMSNVSNNTSPFEPIIAGSSLGFVSL